MTGTCKACKIKEQCVKYSELRTLVQGLVLDMKLAPADEDIFDFDYGCYQFEPIDKVLTIPHGVVE